MKKYLITLLLILISCGANAERVQVTAKVQVLGTYSEQPGYDGDIVIIISNPPPSCPGGFWLRSANTAGYKNAVSFLVTAFHSGATLILGGLDDQIWTGSAAKYCRLNDIALSN